MANNRSSHQTARKGWRPAKTSDRQLISDIVASIQAHAEAGYHKTADEYTQRVEIIEAVNARVKCLTQS